VKPGINVSFLDIIFDVCHLTLKLPRPTDKLQHMLNIVLYQPEIPPNTGNIIRLCANTGCRLYLIEPLGFELDNRKLKRAGLDYHEFANVDVLSSLDELDSLRPSNTNNSSYALSTKGCHNYSDATFLANDTLIFGPETRGLPQSLLNNMEPEKVLRIPMLEQSRSLNLSNAVAIVTYEALRQTGFKSLQIK
jgi:tRNA (cytidine/uridine-2'-O-)-methyltransferase